MADNLTNMRSDEWVTFPGGELEGRRPKALCAACRERLNREAQCAKPSADGFETGRRVSPRRRDVLCFACYRAGLERERALKAAAELDTASEERFQSALPFEPVDTVRLERLKRDRAASRAAVQRPAAHCADRRRRAQIEARRALQSVFEGVRARRVAAAAREQQIAAAIHAAELQLHEAWLPFVVSR